MPKSSFVPLSILFRISCGTGETRYDPPNLSLFLQWAYLSSSVRESSVASHPCACIPLQKGQKTTIWLLITSPSRRGNFSSYSRLRLLCSWVSFFGLLSSFATNPTASGLFCVILWFHLVYSLCCFAKSFTYPNSDRRCIGRVLYTLLGNFRKRVLILLRLPM
jgi:hypothetical protein